MQQALTHFQKLMPSHEQDVGMKAARERWWPCVRNALMLSQSRRHMPASCASTGEAEAGLQAHHQPELYRETLSQKSVISKRKRKSMFKNDLGSCSTSRVHEKCSMHLQQNEQATLRPSPDARGRSTPGPTGTGPTKTKQKRSCDATREITRLVFCFEFQASQASHGVQGQPGQHGKSETSLDCRASWRPA